MKKMMLFFITMLLFSIQLPAQTVWFTSPAQNGTITSTEAGSTQSTIRFNFQYGFKNPNNNRKIELYTDNGNYLYNNIPATFDRAPGTYTWTLKVWEQISSNLWQLVAQKSNTFTVKHTIKVQNNLNVGNIKIDGINKVSGSSAKKITNETLAVGALDVVSGDYKFVWNQSGNNQSKWEKRRFQETSFTQIIGLSQKKQ